MLSTHCTPPCKRLYLVTFPSTNFFTSSFVNFCASAVGCLTTQAMGASSPSSVGRPMTAASAIRWVFKQQSLKFCGSHLVAFDFDEFLFAVDDEEVACFVNIAYVAGLEPAIVGKSLCCGFWISPVPSHVRYIRWLFVRERPTLS